MLMDRGAGLALVDSAGLTPLHHVAFGGHVPTARRLLAAGVPVNLRDKKERTPLTIAVKQGHAEVADLLRRHGGEE